MISPQRPRILRSPRPLSHVASEHVKAKVALAFVSSVVVLICFQNVCQSFLPRSPGDHLLASIPSSNTLSERRRINDNNDGGRVDQPEESTTTTTTACLTIPILPLISSVKYSHRPTSHLTMDWHNLTPVGLPLVSLRYLNNSFASLKAEYLYPLQNYQRWYESAVTHVWIAILQALQGQESEYMVVDGGMNTGFYTTLTAVMGFDVHSFELQLDCFDVTRMLLRGNDVSANLYHIGISDRVQVMEAGEGCHPGYSIVERPKLDNQLWEHQTHQVMLLPLDAILDQIRKDRQIALIKLDLEGNEIVALRGLQRHLHAVQNIIMEISPSFSRTMGVTFEDMQDQFHRLETAGLRPYLLWLPQIETEGWFNATYLKESGVNNAREHPILGANFTIGSDFSNMLWEIESYQLLFTNTCSLGCNVWFTRRQQQLLRGDWVTP